MLSVCSEGSSEKLIEAKSIYSTCDRNLEPSTTSISGSIWWHVMTKIKWIIRKMKFGLKRYDNSSFMYIATVPSNILGITSSEGLDWDALTE